MTIPSMGGNLDGFETHEAHRKKVLESQPVSIKATDHGRFPEGSPGFVDPKTHRPFPDPAFGTDKGIMVGQTDDPDAPNYIDPKYVSTMEITPEGPPAPDSVEPPPLPLGEFRVQRRYEVDEVSGKTTRIVITVDNPPSEDAMMIYRELLPDWMRQFGWKNKDYANEGDGAFHTADLLGARGQFADMWRKMGKLYRALWEGREMKAEKPEEMVTDLIGHCFLTLNYLSKKDDK